MGHYCFLRFLSADILEYATPAATATAIATPVPMRGSIALGLGCAGAGAIATGAVWFTSTGAGRTVVTSVTVVIGAGSTEEGTFIEVLLAVVLVALSVTFVAFTGAVIAVVLVTFRLAAIGVLLVAFKGAATVELVIFCAYAVRPIPTRNSRTIEVINLVFISPPILNAIMIADIP